MVTYISWRLMFRAANRQAFDRCIERTLPLIGDSSKLAECQPYWKKPTLWEGTVHSPALAESVAQQILDVLLIAQRLGTGWCLSGSVSATSVQGFGASLSIGDGGGSSHIAGLEWASFDFVQGEGAAPSLDARKD